jgi:hypothetical protein
MTRSIFDPGGGETERSGSTFLGPDATGTSHVPPEAVDGQAELSDPVGMNGSDRADGTAQVASDADDAARRLREMTGDSTGLNAQ